MIVPSTARFGPSTIVTVFEVWFATKSVPPAVKLAGILERHPVPPLEQDPSLPARLQDIILKALEKNREERYQSAREMLVDLRRLLREIDSGAVTGVTSERRCAGGS